MAGSTPFKGLRFFWFINNSVSTLPLFNLLALKFIDLLAQPQKRVWRSQAVEVLEDVNN
jgi:hypothetical protein